MRIAIVGLGVGGSVAAMALAKKGLTVNVYEQAAEIKEVGAGVSIGPNAVKPLRELGLGSMLDKVGCKIGSPRIMTKNGELIESVPAIAGNDGVPGYQCHRADLLNSIVERIPPASIHLSHRCVDIQNSEREILLRFDNGYSVTCDVLVAADGLRSPIQHAISGERELIFSGLAAYRGLIDADRLPGSVNGQMPPEFLKSTFWTDSKCYFLSYPVSAGRQLNFVGVVPTGLEPDSNWFGEAPLADLQREFEGWCDGVQKIITSVPQTFRWGMYYRRPMTWMVSGRTALIGDAAHPMVIHAGQGAVQAIEDAFLLTELIGDATLDNIDDRLALYERLRLPRTAAVQKQSLANAQFLTKSVVVADEDRVQPGTALGGRSSLYDYDIVAEARKHC